MAGSKHGSKAVFQVQDSGGTLRDLSAYLTEDSLERTADTAETTPFGKTSKTYIPGLKDATISLGGNYDATAVSGISVVLEGILAVERNFELYPAGNVTGERKYTGAAILTQFSVSSPVDGKVAISGEFQVTGDVTAAAVP